MENYIGNNINMIRVEKGLSQEQFAKIAGVSQQTVSSWETGASTPRKSAVNRIVSALPDLTADSILSDKNGYYQKSIEWEEKQNEPEKQYSWDEFLDFMANAVNYLKPDALSNSSYTDVPLFGSIAAGTPIEMIEVDDTFPIPTRMHEQYPNAFLLKVVGSSMNRILPDGCYALIDPCDDIEVDNKPYAVCVNGNDATIKRVHKLANGFELVPDSTDPTFKARVYDYGEEGTEKITVIGRVVYHVIPFDWSY